MENVKWLLVIVSIILIFACANPEQLNTNDNLKTNDVYSELLRHSETQIIPIPTSSAPQITDQIENTKIERTTKYSEAKQVQDILLLGANDDVVYAGVLSPYDSAFNGSFSMPFDLPRNTAILSVDLLSGLPISIEFNPRCLSNFRNAVSKLLIPLTGSTIPARVEFNYFFLKKESGFAYNVGTSAKWMTGNISFTDEASNTNIKTRMIIELKQIYYKVSVDRLNINTIDLSNIDDFTFERMKKSSPLNLTYISSISYGRISFLCVSSSYDESTVKSSFNMGLNSIAASGSLNIDSFSRQVITESNIRALTYGGDVGDALAINSTDSLTAFINYMENDKVFDPRKGLPLVVSMRSLKDGALVGFNLYNEYTIKEYLPIITTKLGYREHFFWGVSSDNYQQYISGGALLTLNSSLLDSRLLSGTLTISANKTPPVENVMFLPTQDPNVLEWKVRSKTAQMTTSGTGACTFVSTINLYYGTELFFSDTISDEWWDIGRITPRVSYWY